MFQYKIMVPLFGAAYAVPSLYLVQHMLYLIKAPQFYTYFL